MSGINKLLYDEDNNSELVRMLTKEEVKNHLCIKDDRLFMKLINEQHLPYLKIGRQLLIPLDKYKQWLRNNTYNY